MGMSENRLCAIWAAFLWLGIAPVAPLQAASAPAAPAETRAPRRSFASSEDAVNTFITALRDHREADLRAILGPQADRVIDSGDKYADQKLHARFLTLYDQKHSIKQAGPGQAELDVGPDDWPLPIPLVQTDGRWTFDTAAGAEMIVDRRIGRNELSAIRTLLACVDAQHDYFDRTKQQTGKGVYAARF